MRLYINIIIVLPVMLMLIACTYHETGPAEHMTITETDSADSNNLTNGTGTNNNMNMDEYDSKQLTGWCGYYTYPGSWQPDHNTSIDLIIYQDRENYRGYLSLDESVKREGTDYDRTVYAKMVVDVIGNEDMAEVYFYESLMAEGEGPERFNHLQKGDLLFTLRREKDVITTRWNELQPDESADEQTDEFASRDTKPSLILVNQKDKRCFFESIGISEQEQPFYQYCNEDGILKLDFYFDEAQRTGTGVVYKQSEDGETMAVFSIDNYNTDIWKDNKLTSKEGDGAGSDSDEYEEEHIYNEQGQLTYFCSRGMMVRDKTELLKVKLIEIEFTYRQDGTLQQKKYGYNSMIFGSTGSSGTCYFDKQERLTFASSYITHGHMEDYYIYAGDSDTPSYSIKLDYMGGDVAGVCITEYTNSDENDDIANLLEQQADQIYQIYAEKNGSYTNEYHSLNQTFRVCRAAVGDLNHDGTDDMAVVVEDLSPVTTTEDEMIPDNRRESFVLLNDNGKYRILCRNNGLVMGEEQGGVFGDPFNRIVIEDGVLLIKNYGGSSSRWGEDYSFIYDADSNNLKMSKKMFSSYSTLTASGVIDSYDYINKRYEQRSESGMDEELSGLLLNFGNFIGEDCYFDDPFAGSSVSESVGHLPRTGEYGYHENFLFDMEYSSDDALKVVRDLYYSDASEEQILWTGELKENYTGLLHYEMPDRYYKNKEGELSYGWLIPKRDDRGICGAEHVIMWRPFNESGTTHYYYIDSLTGTLRQ